MEIHPPHGTIQSVKDFSLQLLTITVGILIALSLDGAFEWRHRRHLVHHAEVTLAAEIRNNRDVLRQGIQRMDRTQTQLQAILGVAEELRASRTVNLGALSLDVSVTTMSATAWNTAGGTGALGHMEYGQVERYTRLYDLQHQFMNLQQSELAALIELESYGSLLKGDLKRISNAQFVEGERAVGRAIAGMRMAEDIGKALEAEYSKFLDQK